MTYRQIESSREMRLWMTQIVIPMVALGAIAWSNPDIRFSIKSRWHELKNHFRKEKNE